MNLADILCIVYCKKIEKLGHHDFQRKNNASVNSERWKKDISECSGRKNEIGFQWGHFVMHFEKAIMIMAGGHPIFRKIFKMPLHNSPRDLNEII